MNYKKTALGLGVILLALICLFHVVVTNAVNQGPNQVKVGISYMTMNNDFYKILNAEIKKTFGERQDILYVRDPELDENKQSQQIDYFVEQKVDVIVITPIRSDSKAILSSLRRAKKNGIKIIALDTPLKDPYLADSTVVSDNYEAGVLLAKQMMATLSEASILLLEHPETVSATDRIAGFEDTIKGHKEYQVIARKDTLGQTEVGMPEVTEVLENGGDFDVVMALNDRSAIGALAAIKDKSYANQVLIYGIDGSPDMKNLLATTTDVGATVAQSPLKMGQKTVDLIYRLAEKQAVNPTYIIPVTLLTPENIHLYDVTGWQ
ncbi:substrate-binding domain-containing protein [Streptococcus cameli]